MAEKIDFGELVLKGDVDAPAARKPAKKAKADLEVASVSGCDIVLRRTTASTSRLLVLLVSQEQYFVKDERSGKVDVIAMREADGTLRYGGTQAAVERKLGNFLQGTAQLADGGSLRTGATWLPELDSSKDFRTCLLNLIGQDDFAEFARLGARRLVRKPRHYWSANDWMAVPGDADMLNLKQPIRDHRALTRDILSSIGEDGAELIDLGAWLQAAFSIEDAVGLDDARKLLAAAGGVRRLPALATLLAAPAAGTRDVEGMRRMSDRKIFNYYDARDDRSLPGGYEAVRFDTSRLISYATDSARRQGFEPFEEDFVGIWADALAMQATVYGRVIDKYPDSLLTMHHVLCKETIALAARAAAEESAEQAERDRGLWAEVVNRAEPMLFEKGGFAIVTPTCAEDMMDEARQQRNCLASYIDRAKAGETSIFFVRALKAPDKSLVTVEVNPETKRIAQAYGPCNSKVFGLEADFIREWAAAKGLTWAA